jgi:hypothetical protein
MKVYIVTEGKPNTGREFSIRGVCANEELAEQIQKAFPYYNLVITEYEVAQ